MMFAKKILPALVAGSMLVGSGAAVAQSAAPPVAIESVDGESALRGGGGAAAIFVLVAFVLLLFGNEVFFDDDEPSSP
jgi:hypothetical protein